MKLMVTEPLLPDLSDFDKYLQRIWTNKILTNGGPLHQELERELACLLDAKHISLFANATLALAVAQQALGLTGEVITTPYSFVGTAHTLVWNNLTPVFIDIEQSGFNMDAKKIKAAITEKTSAIMPVHCYGMPCNVAEIQEIADNYGLKVIYDAAHAFCVRNNGEMLTNYGDMSILSFHATKVFNTFEGGAVICNDLRLKQQLDSLKNFGIYDETTVTAIGINGKMSELHAAVGLAQLKNIKNAIALRKSIYELYAQLLSDVQGVTLIAPPASLEWNYAYLPILIDNSSGMLRNRLYERLKTENIYARRYFYPLITSHQIYSHYKRPSLKLENAANRADEVLCLPIYPSLKECDVKSVCRIVKDELAG